MGLCLLGCSRPDSWYPLGWASLSPFPSAPPPKLQLDLAPATTGSLATLLLLVAACGACDGLAQGALFGEAALLPPRYTQALVSGTAASGWCCTVGGCLAWLARSLAWRAALVLQLLFSGCLIR